jgi:hypothetical protein
MSAGLVEGGGTQAAQPLLHAAVWRDLQDATDGRGRLTAIEAADHVPFDIARVFYVHEVLPGLERAGHAHIDTDQLAIAVHGSLHAELSDGFQTLQFSLDNPARGLFLPRGVFVRLRSFSPGAVCLVLANTHYDRARSLRSWSDYLAFRGLR